LFFLRNPDRAGPSYRQLTFRRGPICSARFAPDGRTVVYGAAWDGNPTELFLTRPDSPESQSLGTRADVLAISPKDEIAVSLERRVARLWESSGTLARLPLAGGTPRLMLDGVKDADWAADGDRLAVVRRVDGRDRLEFPIGTTLYESPGFIIAPRLSRDGQRVALLERHSGDESVIVIRASGERHELLSGQASKTGLAWSASGQDLFVTIVTGGSTAVHAVTLSGERRTVIEAPGQWKLHDISREGHALLTRDHTRGHVVAFSPGSPERDLSWHDRSVAMALSADGTKVLLSEIGAAAGEFRAVYLRNLDGSAAVKLGDGQAQSLSPDGRWAIANQGSAPERLVLLPVGPGQAKPVKNGAIADYFGVRWLPDGKHIAFGGIEPGGELRQYLQDVEGGDPRPAPWRAGVAAAVFQPDGHSFIARARDGGRDNGLYTFELEGGSPQPVVGALNGDYPLAVTSDGQSLFVYSRADGSPTIQRIDRPTGRRELWRTVTVSDRAGVMHTGPEFPLLLTEDGQTYVYNYVRMLSDLYLVDGLR
jgi:Tol biopolymer transport system component